MKKVLLSVLMICAVFAMQAQKAKGDFSVLTGQKQLNVVFVYDGVTYDGDSEAKFFQDHSDRDDFDQWKSNLTSRFRSDMWESEFLEELNEELVGKHISCGDYPNAAYTIIVKMIDIDPGSFAGPFSVPCKLTADVNFVATGTTEPVATVSFTKMPGNGFEMTPIIEHRVKFAFDEMGETLGEILKKKIK